MATLESHWKNKDDVRQLADGCYPYVTFGADRELDVTHEQATVLFRKWKQDGGELTWAEFAGTVQPTIGCDGAVVVKWCDMWLCVERDGYTHTQGMARGDLGACAPKLHALGCTHSNAQEAAVTVWKVKYGPAGRQSVLEFNSVEEAAHAATEAWRHALGWGLDAHIIQPRNVPMFVVMESEHFDSVKKNFDDWDGTLPYPSAVSTGK